MEQEMLKFIDQKIKGETAQVPYPKKIQKLLSSKINLQYIYSCKIFKFIDQKINGATAQVQRHHKKSQKNRFSWKKKLTENAFLFSQFTVYLVMGTGEIYRPGTQDIGLL